MGRACGTYGSEEKWLLDCSWGNLIESDPMNDLDVGERIILK